MFPRSAFVISVLLWVFSIHSFLFFPSVAVEKIYVDCKIKNSNYIFNIFRELQAASGEWINEYARGHESRRDSITKEYLPASDIIKKSIRRSWTISSK